jgi:lipopolysaccharide transport system ATP-binding protein
MPHDIAIKVENLTKIYKLYDSPQDRLKESLHPLRKKYHNDFYALNDVSFEIKKGETVGIIGKNGCGKSTLLKVITGVLTPNSGTTVVDGKISALLELGAGFNPEMTGVENVYFNGTLLGYSKAQMDERFDNILSFADIGQFVHQPVKTYSSGMFVRLAFAVAINVDPDILIIDEALSVGDEAFQRKCFSRIADFQQNGKTILFVSHSATSIIELCDKALLFDQGELLLEGAPKPVVSRYQKLVYTPVHKLDSLREELRSLAASIKENRHAADDEAAGHPAGDSVARLPSEPKLTACYDPYLMPQSTVVYESQGATITNPHITSIAGEKVNILIRGAEYVYTYTVDFEADAQNVRFGMLIKTVSGFELGGMVSNPTTKAIDFMPLGTTKKVVFSFKCVLLPGTYFLNAGVVGSIGDSETYLHRLIDTVMFRVQPEEHLMVTGTVDLSTGQTTSSQLTERSSR